MSVQPSALWYDEIISPYDEIISPYDEIISPYDDIAIIGRQLCGS